MDQYPCLMAECPLDIDLDPEHFINNILGANKIALR